MLRVKMVNMTYPSEVPETASPPAEREDAQPEEDAAFDPVCQATKDLTSLLCVGSVSKQSFPIPINDGGNLQRTGQT